MQQLLQQSDTLKLTRKQADSIATLNYWYVLKSDSIWNPVTQKADRVGFRTLDDGRKVRYFKSNGEQIGA